MFAAGEMNAKRPNFSDEFLDALQTRVGSVKQRPEDIFAYIYAVLNSPRFIARYGDFLKRDFPRLPLPSDARMMKTLAKLGHQLIDLHLLRAKGENEPSYPILGNNCVDLVKFKEGRIYINAEQYFDGVSSAVWEFNIGGYQVAEKWLKDRKQRLLTFDELRHYVCVIAALDATIAVQSEIDAALPLGELTLPNSKHRS